MSPETSTPTPNNTAKPPFYKNPWLIGFFAGAVALTVLPLLQTFAMKAPPPVASLGEWHLLDQDGQPLSNETLKGQVWIASFFFSRCPSICPQQQADFQKILSHVDDLNSPDKKPIRLVSFSVDPEYDTPPVLKTYADKHGEPKDRWTFATGDEAALKELLVKRMFIDIGEKTPLPGSSSASGAEVFDIGHVAKFVLVDQNGDVRGYWDTDELGRGNLINAARLLWKRGPKV